MLRHKPHLQLVSSDDVTHDQIVGPLVVVPYRERVIAAAEGRVLEDALCLVFLETQFAETTAKTGEDKMIVILQKTWKKMTPQARAVALTLPMSAELRALVEKALNPHA